MRQIIEIVKAIKGKKYIIASWCIIIINGFFLNGYGLIAQD